MDAIMEFLRLYLPTITSVLMTIVIPLIFRYGFTRSMNKSMFKTNKSLTDIEQKMMNSLAEVEKKLTDCVDAASLTDIRQELQELRGDISQMMGRPHIKPRGGRDSE